LGNGYFLMDGIPAGNPYILTVSEFKHVASELEIAIKDGEMTSRNITLTERDMMVNISPDGSEEAISVDQVFIMEFHMAPDLGTLNVALENATSSVSLSIEAVENTTQVEITPDDPLIFNSPYTLSLDSELKADGTEELLVWRPLSWSFVTALQPITAPFSDPARDALDIPLDKEITLSFGIGINHSSFSTSLNNMDFVVEDVPITIHFNDRVNWSDSGRTDTFVMVIPENLTYSTRYSLEVSDLLKDIHGRSLLEEPLMIEFTTNREPDGDGDGVVDSLDVFPEDPNEWSDLDGDGVGDNADKFPRDPDETKDLDGDGIGDNSDTDDDGDQMSDTWELENGLDPTNSGDAFMDSDNDDYNNLEEYLEGTDPWDKNDHPKEAGFDTSLIVIGVIIAMIVIVVVVVILFMLGIVGKKKSEPIEEE
jgi:Bacterial Ig-like domain